MDENARLLRMYKKFADDEDEAAIPFVDKNWFQTLFWVCVLLMLLLYVTGIFMTMTVGANDELYDDYKKESGGWDHEEFFGTVGRSMFTLFQVVSLENWTTKVARHVISNQPQFAFFFFVFVMFTTYGMLNLVLGVIVEGTLAEAKQNTEKMKQKQDAERLKTLEYLRDIFEDADEDKSGTMDLSEFEKAMEDKTVQKKLRLIDLPVQDAKELYNILDADGSGSLSIDEFIGGCLRLKGHAKSKDLLAVQMSVECLAEKIDEAERNLTQNEHRMDILDKLTLNIGRKYESVIEDQHEKVAAVINSGTGPVLIKKAGEQKELQEARGYATGARRNLPPFPGFLQ